MIVLVGDNDPAVATYTGGSVELTGSGTAGAKHVTEFTVAVEYLRGVGGID